MLFAVFEFGTISDYFLENDTHSYKKLSHFEEIFRPVSAVEAKRNASRKCET